MDTEVRRRSVWKRAWDDTESFRKSSKFFWGWEVLGAIALAIVTYFLLPDESAFLPAIAGVIGFTAVFIIMFFFNLVAAPIRQRNEAWDSLDARPSLEVPRLAFGELKVYQRESIFTVAKKWPLAGGHVEEIPLSMVVRLCRVPLTNVVPGTVARNVRVTLSSTPQLDQFPVDVHEKHDNAPPYRRERSIRHGETIEFDVIAHGNDGRYYLFRSDLPPDGYVQQVDDPNFLYAGFALRLTAITDPPGEGDEGEYRLTGSVLQEMASVAP